MTKTLTINEVDFTSKWRADESGWTSRAHMGESAQSTFVIDDDDGTIDHANFASRKIVEVWEDASGTAVCLYRGRMMNHTLHRGDVEMGVAMQWTLNTEDYNIDLRGIRVTSSTRSSESDYTRVLAYAAGYLAGTASTNAHARDSTDLGTTYVVNDDTVTLPAETYTYTYPFEILQRISEVAGKTYFVFVDDEGDGQLYYASITDTTFASDISITDAGTADGEDSYAPIYVGPPGDHEGQHVISGGGLEYLNGAGFYEESNIASGETNHDKWEEHLTDDFVQNATDAANLLQAIVGSRDNEQFNYTCAIKMQASEVHRIKAGMTLSVRLAAANLVTPETLRAVQVTVEPTDPDWYLVSLELGWPRDAPLIRRRGNGPRAPAQPTDPVAGDSVRLYHSDDRAGTGDSASSTVAPGLTHANKASAWDAHVEGTYVMLYDAPVGSGVDTPYEGVNMPANDYFVRGTTILISDVDGLLEIIQDGGTVRGQQRARSRSGVGINEGAQNHIIETTGRIYRPGSGFVATLWDVGDLTGDLKFAAQTTPVNRSWGGAFDAYASAADTDYLVVEYGFVHAGPISGGSGAGIPLTSAGASDLPEDQVTTTNLRSWVEFTGTGSAGTPGDVPEPVGSEGSPGDNTGQYAAENHVHAHGFLSTSETRYHDDTHIEVTGTDGVNLGANVADALDLLASKLAGGTDGQVLTKQSGDDYDVDWETPSGGGGGSVFDVTDYGAEGDGSTDDTAAIQAAIDAAEANGNGSRVYFPIGASFYRVTDTLTVTAALHFIGPGNGEGPGSAEIQMETADKTLFSLNDNADRAVFENLYLTGPGSNSSGNGILTTKSVTTVRVRVQGFYNNLHIGAGAFYSKLWQSMFHDADQNAVLIADGATNVDVFACRIQGSPVGLYAAGCEKLGVYGGSIEACTTYGARIDSGTQTTEAILFSGIYFENQSSTAIRIGQSGGTVYNVRVESCHHHSGETWFIDANGVDGLTIADNSYEAGAGDRSKIRATSSANVTIGYNSGTGPYDGTLPTSTIFLDPAGLDARYVGGVEITGTPTAGQVPIATDSDSAAWGDASASGHYEVLMASGGADPLETSDGLDWLYVFVSD